MLRALLLASSAVLAACAAPSDPSSNALTPEDAGEREAAQLDRHGSLEHAAAGWIEHRDSPVRPWCHVVLVAPSVAVTAASCIDGTHPDELRVGFGAETEITERDVAALLDLGDGLVAAQLAEPTSLEPVTLGRLAPDDCALAVPRYVSSGAFEVPSRTILSGCAHEDDLALEGNVGHGVHGGAVFNAEGELGGVIVGRLDGDAHFKMLKVSNSGDAFERALSWGHE